MLIDSNHSVQRSRVVFSIKCVPFVFVPMLSVFRAESTHGIDDKTYHQNQANPATAENRAAKVKSAATEQQKQNK